MKDGRVLLLNLSGTPIACSWVLGKGRSVQTNAGTQKAESKACWFAVELEARDLQKLSCGLAQAELVPKNK